MTPPVLHTIADALRLEGHAQVDKRDKILGHLEHIQHLPHHQGISTGVFLMKVHNIRSHVPFSFIGIGPDGFDWREPLETELAHEAWVLIPISCERFAPVPDIPIVGIALTLPIWVFKGSIGGWRTGPVGMIGVLGLAPGGQSMMKKLAICCLQTLEFGNIPVPVDPTPFHFIIAAPQRKAGAMSQAADIINYFQVDILEESGII